MERVGTISEGNKIWSLWLDLWCGWGESVFPQRPGLRLLTSCIHRIRVIASLESEGSLDTRLLHVELGRHLRVRQLQLVERGGTYEKEPNIAISSCVLVHLASPTPRQRQQQAC